MKHFIALLISFLVATTASGQRLNEGWEYVKGDIGGVWEAVRAKIDHRGKPEDVPVWSKVTLPHCFNATDSVDPDVAYYQGPGWYRTFVEIENPHPQGRALLHFEGAGQKTEVYVGLRLAGEHVGGYDEWTIDVTDALDEARKNAELVEKYQGRIPIIIRCDNSRDLQMMPSDLSDFNVYGGLYRYVNLKLVPALSLGLSRIDASVDVNGTEGKVAISTRLHNPTGIKRATVDIEIRDPDDKVVASHSAEIEAGRDAVEVGTVQVPQPALWSPESPNLYTCRIRLTSSAGTSEAEHPFGFRHFEFVKHGPFKLNGKRLLLRGTHRHEDHAGVAAAMTEETIIAEMEMMKEMGVNFIRLGHYQQSRIVLDACDRLGILVWEEIPWCRGGIGGEIYQQQGRRMLKNMIDQHFNHPSVIIWGLGNENDWPGDTPNFDEATIRQYMIQLNELSHQLDPGRKTAIRRCEFCKDIVDVYSPSIWAGWYRGKFTSYRDVTKKAVDSVDHFFHAEWGASNHAGRHSETPDHNLESVGGNSADEREGDASLYGGPPRVSKDGDWSETYACNLIDWHLKEQELMPYLTGTAYWPFKDFSTPIRPDNPVPYVNQKGVVERDFTKKEAFYVFQSYWTDDPMIRIYGHTWPTRWGKEGEARLVKVYSNCDEVELFVNGESLGRKKRDSQNYPAAGLRWRVKFVGGDNKVEAVGFKNGEQVKDKLRWMYETQKWSKPATMQLTTSKVADNEYQLEVLLRDKNGVPCLDSTAFVRFSITGDARLVADQGTSSSASKVQVYNGRAHIKAVLDGDRACVGVSSNGLETQLKFIGAPSG
jgi:beta-galactosidase